MCLRSERDQAQNTPEGLGAWEMQPWGWGWRVGRRLALPTGSGLLTSWTRGGERVSEGRDGGEGGLGKGVRRVDGGWGRVWGGLGSFVLTEARCEGFPDQGRKREDGEVLGETRE